MLVTMDNIYATRILYLLLMPFTKQKAYELGYIDKNGNHLKNATEDNLHDYDQLHKVIFKIKQLINRLPGGEFRLKQIAIALQLLRRKIIPKMYMDGIEESIEQEFIRNLTFMNENSLSFIEEELFITKKLDTIVEEGEAIVNTTAGIEPHGEPVIDPKKKKEKKDVAEVARATLTD